MAQTDGYRIDHLALADTDLQGVRLVVFHGRSGSGKTAAIEYLLKHCEPFRQQGSTRISGGPIDWSRAPAMPEPLVVLDELVRPRDMFAIAGLLARGHTVIAASHLPAWLTALIALRWRSRHFATDRERKKIMDYLDLRGIRYSTAAVERYCRQFGATFTDIDIMLERHPGRDFDRSLDRFLRHCRLRAVPVAR